MEMKPVQSSNIRTIGYDAEARRLQIEFGSGKTYAYDEFPSEEHAALMSAPSIGSHFARHIRSKYPGVEVKEPDWR